MARIQLASGASPLFLLLGFALLALACDGSLSPEGSEPLAERPEGWESLEDEAAASRLYYQFVDAQRRVRFVERIEDVPEPLRAGVGFVKMSVAPPLSPGDAARARKSQVAKRGGTTTGRGGSATGAAPAAEVAASSVVLYSAEWCGACKKAKRHLARQGYAYEERNVDRPEFASELQQKTGRRAIPVLDANGRIVTGFNAQAYDQLLGS